MSEEVIAKASKDDPAETPRILAMEAAHMTAKEAGEQHYLTLPHLLDLHLGR
ncbi:MAG: hypothetical protein IPN48_08350 [Sphingomonadales bacterium]|nr:hypothetical protein [Sphingomonadales bacterium]